MITLKLLKQCILSAILISSLTSLISQKRVAIAGIDVINKTNKSFFQVLNTSSSGYVYSSVPTYCVNFFSNNKKFITIDRQNLNLINNERELQKSEDFIDGYIVEQGKSEGVDYMVKSIYYDEKKTLNIRIYDVNEGIVKCSTEKNLESNFFGIKQLEKQVRYLLHQLMWDCFQTKFAILRASDPKDTKYKELLVAMGRKSKIDLEDKVEIFEMVEENLGDEKVTRKEVIGFGEIKEIQDDNFSVVKIIKNNKEIAGALSSGKKLFCIIYSEI